MRDKKGVRKHKESNKDSDQESDDDGRFDKQLKRITSPLRNRDSSDNETPVKKKARSRVFNSPEDNNNNSDRENMVATGGARASRSTRASPNGQADDAQVQGLREEVEALTEQNDLLTAQNEKQAKYIKKLQQNNMVLKTAVTSAQTLKQVPVNALIEKIKSCVETVCWNGKQKFVSSDAQLLKLTGDVIDHLDVTYNDDRDRMSYMATYKKEVNRALNKVRSYKLSKLKKLVFSFLDLQFNVAKLDENGAQTKSVDPNSIRLPTKGNWLHLVLRKSPATDTQFGLLEWYFEQVLPVLTSFWTTEMANFDIPFRARAFVAVPTRETISSKPVMKSVVVPAVHPTVEAMFVLFMDGNCDGWLAEWKWKKNPTNDADDFKTHCREKVNKATYENKYASRDGGQKDLHGYTDQGLRKYIDVLKQIVKVQKETKAVLKVRPEDPPAYYQTELDTLKRLRVKNEITEKTAEEESQKKRSKKGKKNNTKKKRVELDELDVDLEADSDEDMEIGELLHQAHAV